MTCAVEDVGEAPAGPGYIVELCAVLEGIDRNAASVDLRDPQRRVPFWSIRIAMCSVDSALERGIRIYDLRADRQVTRDRCGPDQKRIYRSDLE